MPNYVPPTITFLLTAVGSTPPGAAQGLGSFLDVRIDGSSPPLPYPLGWYEAWCVDRSTSISVPGTYTAKVYSSQEIGVLEAVLPKVGDQLSPPVPSAFIGNLDNVSWLTNHWITSNASLLGQGYTYGDVQQALYTLLGDGLSSSSFLGPWDAGRVTTLANTALASGDGFLPDVDQYVSVVLDPVDGAGVHQQPLIIEMLAAKLGDFVWNDIDANGIQDDDEPGIANAAVRLVRDLDGNGDIDVATETLATTTTNGVGYYEFRGLTPGLPYQVQFVTPAGFGALSPRQQGADTAKDSDGLLSNVVVLAPGEFDRTVDSGFHVQALARLGDLVWLDKNANGLQDAGENGLSGVTVRLLDANGNFITSTTTVAGSDDPATPIDEGAAGYYEFTGLTPGVGYQVEFVNPDPSGPDAYVFSAAHQGGNAALDSDGPTSGAVTLSSGEFNRTLDAGLYRPGSLHVFGFLDTDGDGQLDIGEQAFPNAPGKTIELLDAGGSVVATKVTVNGVVDFEGLKPGTYTVRENPIPGGYLLTTPTAVTVTIESGQEYAYQKDAAKLPSGDGRVEIVDGRLVFGNTQLASLGDRIWVDTNGNGLQDDGATGISGLAVALVGGGADKIIGTADDTEATTLTGADGFYQFTGLAPGVQYQVQFSKPVGTVYTTRDANGNTQDALDSDADTVTGHSQFVTLASGEYNATIDAGVYTPASLGDRVWVDDNGNGQQDNGEPGLPGVTVELYACGPDGKPAGAALASKTTDASGLYKFDGLKPGDYAVKFVTPAGYAFTQFGAVMPDASGSDSDAGVGGFSGCVNLESGENETRVDAGLYQPAALGDRVWEDKNANGLQDANEPGIAGSTVELFKCVDNAPSGAVLQTKTTDASGNYAFTGLAPGDYIVRFTTPTGGFVQTTANVGNNGSDLTDSDAGTGGLTGCYTLVSGQTDNTVDTGYYKPASLGDRVWVDDNGNGQQDNGEPGLPGVTVELYACGPDGKPAGAALASKTTDASGLYKFDGLKPGDYAVKFVTPAGYAFTQFGAVMPDASGSDSDAGVGGFSGCVNLESGENETRVDAGLVQQAKLGDFVWIDKNADGVQQAGEPGLNGVTVRLLDAAGNVLDTTTTADKAGGDDPATPGNESAGYYEFAGLIPGNGYEVVFINPDPNGPDAYSFSPRQAGGTAATNSDAAVSDLVTLSSGEFNRTLDAGLYRPGSLHVFGFLDTDGDGQLDIGEGAFPDDPGKTIQLIKDGQVVSTKVTVNGVVNFEGLAPGTYTVTENPVPGGYLLTTPGTVTVTIGSGEEYAYKATAANLPSGDARTEIVDTRLVFGNTQLASLGNYVWEDSNADGLQNDGNIGIDNVTVRLLRDTDGNGTPESVVATTTTGDDPDTAGTQVGYYKFTGLTPGAAYQVQLVNPDTVGPDAYFFTTEDAGANDAVDSDADAITGLSQVVTLSSGQYDDTVDAGLYRNGSIHAFGFLDVNGNGVQDGGDGAFPGDPGKTFVLAGPGGFTQTVTTSSGKADWTSLKPGSYTIVESPIPDGYALTTTPNSRSFTVDSGKELVYTQGAANLDASDTRSEVIVGKDLTWGNTQLASLGDRLWLDTNANGIQDDGATGIAGQLVTLIGGGTDKTIGTGGDDTSATTTTGADGFYQFTGLMPGVPYQVQFTKPVNTTFTNKDQGLDDTKDSDVDLVTGRSQIVTLSSGQYNPTIDAGVVAPADIDIDKKADKTFVAPNKPVTYTYTITNPGAVPISNVKVRDDNATPNDLSDDFDPTPQLAGGFNVGDTNKDSKLDPGEIWKYTSTVIPPVLMTVTTGGQTYDSGSLTYTTLAGGDIRVAYRQSFNFNDNTYGTSSDIGWTSQGKTHTFSNLTGSDKAGFEVRDGNGTVRFKFYQDYITASTTNIDGYAAYSGYQSLGYGGGDGGLVTGGTLNAQAATYLYDFDSTLETNLNRAGATTATVNSPLNDPGWDNVNGYSFVVKASAFGNAGFGGVAIFDQHNSPAKTGGSNSYIPDIVGSTSTNKVVVTGAGNGTQVTDTDDETVIIVNGPLGSLGDRVWFDADADGVQDAGEAGIVGALVSLSGDFNGDNSPDYTATATTGANGIYTVTGLPAGRYTVSVDPTTLGGTLTQTYDLDGIGTPDTAVATLTTGQTRTDVDFGYVRTADGFIVEKTADKSTAAPNTPVVYTYLVRNNGTQPITGVTVKDDNGTPGDPGDDFSPARVLPDPVGNGDHTLGVGEVWKYTATVIPPVQMTVTTDGQTYDSGSLTYTTLAGGDIRVAYRQSFNFNDNTYGTSSDVGWTSQGKTHTFSNLTGSDKAGFEVRDGNGTVLFKFYQDYITASTTNLDGYAAYSGYQSLGYSGGDGGLEAGGTLNAQAATYLYDFDSTLETNLNRAGATTATVNSPLNDPGWDNVNGYSFVVKAAAFGSAGFGGAAIFDQHNSPAKTGGSNSYIPDVVGGESTNTVVVTGTQSGQTVAALDDATVIISTGGGGTGGPAKFYVVDSGVDDVFRYAAAGGAAGASSLVAANKDARGITGDAANTRLWVLDKSKTVYVYGTDGSSKGSWTAGGLGKEPEGIALDGQHVWIVDRDAKKLFWYQGAATNLSGSDDPEASFALARDNDKPKGVTTDGTFLWVVEDDSANTVFRYTITKDGSGVPTGIGTPVSWTLDSKNTAPTGITLDPTGVSKSLWVVDSGTDSVYEYAMGTTRTSGSNVAANVTFKLGAGNTAPQDLFDPFIASSWGAGDALPGDDVALVGVLLPHEQGWAVPA